MAKRKFSIERLYKLTRNIFLLISLLGLIASALTFYISKSSQGKLNKTALKGVKMSAGIGSMEIQPPKNIRL
jgi:hypothetical protein